MPQVHANGISIEYDLAGPENGPVILMIMGLAAQMTAWPDPLLTAFHDAGFRTLCFDNRDIGKSEKIHNRKPPNIIRQMIRRRIGLPGGAPYTLETMARDTEGLLNALGIDKVHVMGVSMGGMISQIFAGKYHSRVKSFTAIMSTTNNRALPNASPEISRLLLRAPKLPLSREDAIARSMNMWALIGTKNSGTTQEELRAKVEAAYDRSYYPAGPRRQISAIGETGDLRRFTRKIKAPALIIHGADDPLVPPQGGADIAKNIQGSRLEMIEAMGHDLPKKHIQTLADLMISHFRNAETTPKALELA